MALAVAAWCGVTAQADPPLPAIPANSFNITDHGAFGDGISNNATAIQLTVNAAAAAGGGTVVVAAVGVLTNYLSGPFNLTNNVCLQINSNATIKMLAFGTYPGGTSPPDFISATNLHDVMVAGSGTIDGSAATGTPGWWDGRATSERPLLIKFDTCQKVLVQDIHMKNGAKMHIGFKNDCGNITIQNLTINTPPSPNTDGIDLAGTNCLVKNCTIADGDDNIAFSPTSFADSDILITNCTFGIGHGVSMGSNTAGGLSNLTVISCTFTGTDYGIRMKSDNNTNSSNNGRGGVVQNLSYSNIQMANIVHGAIVIYSYYNEFGTPVGISPFGASTQAVGSLTIPVWRNITISNVTATVSNSGISCIMWGRKETVISNVTLRNVTITGASNAACIYNARAIQLIDSQFTPQPATNSLNLYNAQVTVTNSVPSANLMTLGGLATPPTNNTMAFFNALAAITDTNMLGAGTITLGGSTLTFTQNAVNVSNDTTVVSASTMAVTSGSNTFRGVFSGSGSLTLNVPANTVLTLRGNSAGFNGALAASNSGTLLVNNTAGSGTGIGAVTVLGGTTLGGTGVVGGPVTVNGTLAPGSSPGTLTVSNNLALNSGTALRYELGTTSDLTIVSGNLTLDGTLNVTNAGGFTNTTYTLFTYGGTLTDNGLTIGTMPSTNFTYAVSTSVPGQVNLVVSTAASPPMDPYVAWELQYFNCTNLAVCPQAAGNADPDGDGMSNTNEFLAGTDPTNSASAFRITSVVRTNNDMFISWMTGVGRTNALQATMGDANGNYQTNGFANLFTVFNATGNSTNYTDPGAATSTFYRYYRVRLVP